MKIAYKLLFLMVLAFPLGCNEDLLDQVNPNALTADLYYRTSDEITAATNGIYSQFYGADLWGRNMQYFSDCRADEHSAGGAQLEVHNAQLLNGNYNSGNEAIVRAWRGFYRLIHRANAVIQFAPEVEEMDNALRKKRVAEAKFLRAYGYYYLHVNWGRVPLYTQVAESFHDAQGPAEESEIYELLENDLMDIQNDLDWSYSGTSDAGRASRGAVKLLLARVLMHQGKFGEAKTVLEDIYTNGPFHLMDNYSDNFREENEYNAESIFEIGFSGGFTWDEDANHINARGHMMFQDYSPVAWRNMIPSNALINSFEHPNYGDAKEDPRLRESVYFTGDFFGPNGSLELADSLQGGNSSDFHGTIIKTSWKKYSPMYKLNPGGWYESNINYRNMRFAEVLIKLAECENEVGTEEKAIEYLNEIRARPSVDMPFYPTANYPCNNYDEVLRAIMHESMAEFSNEKLRVLELARWRKLNKFSSLNPDPVGPIASNPNRALLPYPNTETGTNPNF